MSSSQAECPSRELSAAQWLRYGPFLAQLVVTRRCNLSCGYCAEYDKVSEAVPAAALLARLAKLRALRCWAVCLTGGEPTLHPELDALVGRMRELGFRRRGMITNGLKLTRERIESLGTAGLTDLQISIDGVKPNATTKKVLDVLHEPLDLLAAHAQFDVVISAVVGSGPPDEALAVVAFAKERGFTPRILLLHDATGKLELTAAELSAYRAVKQAVGRRASEAGNYRDSLIEHGEAPFKCRAGSRYLYVDEFGDVHWCSAQRGVFSKPLLEYGYEDLREQFRRPKPCHRTCTIGCARTASAYDAWRPVYHHKDTNPRPIQNSSRQRRSTA